MLKLGLYVSVHNETESKDQQLIWKNNNKRSSGSIFRAWTLCLLQLTGQGERPHPADDKGLPVLLCSLNVFGGPR